MKTLLKVEDVQTFINGLHILQGVSFLVPASGVTVLLGRNGAGKTTTLRTILGFSPPSVGQVDFDSRSLVGVEPHAIASLGIGYVPEDRGIFASLTVMENLRVAARDGERAMRQRLPWVFDLFPDLKAAHNRRAGSLSGGQQQMLAIARVLVSENRLLLIDEPSSGLAPIVVEKVAKVMAELKKQLPILMVEQNYQMAKYVADHYCIIESGSSVLRGDMADLDSQDDIKRKYLGVSA